MESIKHGSIHLVKITKNVWIAKTITQHPLKADVEMKGDSEQNAYGKLMKFFELDTKPSRVEELENGNKIYHF